jgi:tetratricopeptide (TPR) repeat protein
VIYGSRAGTTTNNLGFTYRALGRHKDALAMCEKALEFQRRVLPADHPDIGEGCLGSDSLHDVCFDDLFHRHSTIQHQLVLRVVWFAASRVAVRA